MPLSSPTTARAALPAAVDTNGRTSRLGGHSNSGSRKRMQSRTDPGNGGVDSPLADELTRVSPHSSSEIGLRDERAKMRRQRSDVTHGEHAARAAVGHQIARGANGVADHDWLTRIHHFIDDQPPRLSIRRKHEDVAEVVESGQLRLILEANEANVLETFLAD